jgi:hypothetical protein
MILTHLLDRRSAQPLRQRRTFVQYALAVATVVINITLVVMPEVFVVLAAMASMVVVTVLVLMRVGVAGFEVMVGVARRVLVVAGVGLFVENNVRIVE